MPKPTKRNLTSAPLLFAALGDPTRLMLIRQLSEGGPASISMLAEQQDMTRQGVTKHLQVLAAAGIIDSRQGREQVWTLNPKRLAEGRSISTSLRLDGTRRWTASKSLSNNDGLNV